MKHSSAPNQSSFVYDALDPQQKQIRLLKLHKDIDNIQCSMRTINLEHDPAAPDYRCLSYMWGAEQSLKTILVNRSCLEIRPNLYNCLRTLVARGFEHEIWIDQICIEQKAVSERTHQVSMMADIFEGAAEVILWLGEGSSTQEASLKRFQVAPSIAELIDFDTLEDIFHNPYFGRIWIVQELVLAKVITIYSETTVVPWKHLIATAEAGNKSKLELSWYYAVKVNFKYQGRGRALMPIYDLLREFSDRECSDHRDLVFALLSLAKQGRAPIVADYSKTLEAVFIDTLGAIVRDLEGTPDYARNSHQIWFYVHSHAHRLFPELRVRASKGPKARIGVVHYNSCSKFYDELDEREFGENVDRKSLDSWLCEKLEIFFSSLSVSGIPTDRDLDDSSHYAG